MHLEVLALVLFGCSRVVERRQEARAVHALLRRAIDSTGAMYRRAREIVAQGPAKAGATDWTFAQTPFRALPLAFPVRICHTPLGSRCRVA